MTEKTGKKKLLAGAACVLLALVCLFLWKREDTPEENRIQKETQKEGKEIVIGVSLAAENTDYQAELGSIIEELSRENKEYTLDLRYAQWDVNQQTEQMEDFIREGADAIILCPVNAKSMLNVLKETHEAGIPVINLNMKVDMVSSEYIATYVGASMAEEAELAAKLAADYFDGRSGEVGIIEGAPGSAPQIERTQIFLEQIASSPNIDVVSVVNGKWSRSMAALAALDLINRNPGLELIYCHDSNMALGAYETLVKQGREKDIALIGIGNAQEYMDAVRDGKLYGIVSQPPDYEAYYSLVCAMKAVEGSSLRPWYKNAVEIITRDNVDKYRSPMEGTVVFK